MPLQLRRTTESFISTTTFLDGEPVFSTDTHKLFIGDGVTPGGHEIGGGAVSPNSTFTTIIVDGTATISTLKLNGIAKTTATYVLFYDDSTKAVSYEVEQGGGQPQNPFDQDLNTTSSVRFYNATVTNELRVADNVIVNAYGIEFPPTSGHPIIKGRSTSSGYNLLIESEPSVTAIEISTSTVKFYGAQQNTSFEVYVAGNRRLLVGDDGATFGSADRPAGSILGNSNNYPIRLGNDNTLSHSVVVSTASVKIFGPSAEQIMSLNTASIRFHDRYTFPTYDGVSGQSLVTDGAGTISWSTVSGGTSYDQSLNTTDSVTFANITATNTATVAGVKISANNSQFAVTGIPVDADTQAIQVTGNGGSLYLSGRAANGSQSPIVVHRSGHLYFASGQAILQTGAGNLQIQSSDDGAGTLGDLTLSTKDGEQYLQLSTATIYLGAVNDIPVKILSNNQEVATFNSTTATITTELVITNADQSSESARFSTSSIRFYNAYTFPTTDGAADQVLKTDGAGVLSWTTQSSYDQSLNTTDAVTFASMTATYVYYVATDTALGNNAQAQALSNGVAIGRDALANGSYSVAISDADATGQGSVAVGTNAQATTFGAVSIGNYSNASSVGGVALGNNAVAGVNNTQNANVAVGEYASTQFGNYATAVGSRSTASGAYSAALGYLARAENDRTIVLNATSLNLASTSSDGFYVAPIRNSTSSQVLYYDTSTSEIVYGAASSSNPFDQNLNTTDSVEFFSVETGYVIGDTVRIQDKTNAQVIIEATTTTTKLIALENQLQGDYITLKAYDTTTYGALSYPANLFESPATIAAYSGNLTLRSSDTSNSARGGITISTNNGVAITRGGNNKLTIGTGADIIRAEVPLYGPANGILDLVGDSGPVTITSSATTIATFSTASVKIHTPDLEGPTGAEFNITADGTNNINLNADTIRIGDNNTPAIIDTHGSSDLIFKTNLGSTSSAITIFNGANGNIELDAIGTGTVIISGPASISSTLAVTGSITQAGQTVATIDDVIAYQIAIG